MVAGAVRLGPNTEGLAFVATTDHGATPSCNGGSGNVPPGPDHRGRERGVARGRLERSGGGPATAWPPRLPPIRWWRCRTTGTASTGRPPTRSRAATVSSTVYPPVSTPRRQLPRPGALATAHPGGREDRIAHGRRRLTQANPRDGLEGAGDLRRYASCGAPPLPRRADAPHARHVRRVVLDAPGIGPSQPYCLGRRRGIEQPAERHRVEDTGDHRREVAALLRPPSYWTLSGSISPTPFTWTQGPEHFRRIIEATKEYQATHPKPPRQRKAKVDTVKN